MRRSRGGTDRATRGGRGAFTLIELLVVVAIIALLISILLPSMGRAKEQARSVKCLSNLKQIGYAMASYFDENDDWFPFEKNSELRGMHGFYYGGHPGREPWWGYRSLGFRDTPAGRPFNQYLYPGLPKWDVQPDDPLFQKVRDLPIYQCPSDHGGFWNSSQGNDPFSDQLYWHAGSSYTLNWHFAFYWAYLPNSSEQPLLWLQRANAFLRQQMRHGAHRLIMLYEDPFDSAQWNRIPRRGWHGQWNRHNVLFLDSRAASVLADTSKGTSGPGWKSCSGNSIADPMAWWNDPDDPDCQYRDVTPLPRY